MFTEACVGIFMLHTHKHTKRTHINKFKLSPVFFTVAKWFKTFSQPNNSYFYGTCERSFTKECTGLACGCSGTSNVGKYLSLLNKVRSKESSDIRQ